MTLFNQILVALGGGALFFGGLFLGEIKTRDRIYKDAYDNGMMVIEYTNDNKAIFRWRELHKEQY